MSRVFRIYVKKREEFAVEAKEVLENLKVQLKLENLENTQGNICAEADGMVKSLSVQDTKKQGKNQTHMWADAVCRLLLNCQNPIQTQKGKN